MTISLQILADLLNLAFAFCGFPLTVSVIPGHDDGAPGIAPNRLRRAGRIAAASYRSFTRFLPTTTDSGTQTTAESPLTTAEQDAVFYSLEEALGLRSPIPPPITATAPSGYTQPPQTTPDDPMHLSHLLAPGLTMESEYPAPNILMTATHAARRDIAAQDESVRTPQMTQQDDPAAATIADALIIRPDLMLHPAHFQNNNL